MIADGNSSHVPPAAEADDRTAIAAGDHPASDAVVRSLPTPIVRRRRHWTAALVWLVPLIALVAFGFYFRQWLGNRGPVVTIRVPDAANIEPGETPVRSRGVKIGTVVGVSLTGDQAAADVRVQLTHDASAFATEGAVYWVVKPEFGGGSLSGLSTVLSGPYLEARSGAGAQHDAFVALRAAPTATRTGLSIRLIGPNLARADRGTPVLYRGVPVGAVESAMLAEDATHVVLRATIEPRYAPLVRANSQFWSIAPADIKGGIFSGIEVEVGTLKQLLSGGIQFASPDEPFARPAAGDDRFILHDAPEEAWQKWSPKIEIQPADDTTSNANADRQQESPF